MFIFKNNTQEYIFTLLSINMRKGTVFVLIGIMIIIGTVECAMTLQEYLQLERENPANLFEDLQLSDQGENFPTLEKLIFLTPWNKKGFEYTIKYAHKIDYVSPCWYTLKLGKNGIPIFQNQHNYDSTYAVAIKKANPLIKLIPRVYVEGSDINFFQAIGSDFSKFQAAASLIQRVVKEKGLDGIVWDSPYNFFQKERNQLNSLISEFLKQIRKKIGTEKTLMANMANPMNHMTKLDIEQYNELPLDCLLIQNYDSGDDYIAMVSKSLEWSRAINKQTKVMLMLPFFSVKVRVGSLSTEEAVRSLKRMGVAAAEVSKGMCKYTENKTKRVFLIPCFSYYKQVFEMAGAVGASVGFWEGGNGMQKYYTLL